MHSDAYFSTGKAHPVCQDYAFAGEQDGLPFGIVSDGCSSSPHTDIGSRLLAQSLASKISEFRGKRNDELVTRVVTIAAGAAVLLGLPEECLDATLLCCSACWPSPVVSVVGDGVVAIKTKDGNVAIWRVEYKQSAPEYPSYKLDPLRHERFNTEFTPYKKISTWTTLGGEQWGNRTKDFLYGPVFQNAEIVAVMSDGVETFEGMEWFEVAAALMDFKNIKGHFVQRRMKRFIKDCQKNGIAHYDDVSMAAIYLGE